ncbi:MAG: RidA family protein [Methylocystis sp.]|nr:RidA family protein [Methylocystis sp.]
MSVESSNTPEGRLGALGLVLPVAAAPVANYLPWTRSGNLVFVSGQLPFGPNNAIEPAHKGKLGAKVSIAAGQAASARCALNLLAHAKAASGDLARVRCLRLGGFINSTPNFGALPLVLNGASDLMVGALLEAGRHARFAVGVAQLPLDAAVEIDAIFEIMD